MESGNYLPEFVSLANNKNISNLASKDISFGDIWDKHVYGMVGTILKGKIYYCGGGVLPSTCDMDEVYSSTSRCKSFDLMDYSLNLLDIEMQEERTFAQSTMFDNGTWFIMGGQNSQRITSNTTEYLSTSNDHFMNGLEMPDFFSHHCAKMINSSHLFTTGGYKNSRLMHATLLNKG